MSPVATDWITRSPWTACKRPSAAPQQAVHPHWCLDALGSGTRLRMDLVIVWYPAACTIRVLRHGGR